MHCLRTKKTGIGVFQSWKVVKDSAETSVQLVISVACFREHLSLDIRARRRLTNAINATI